MARRRGGVSAYRVQIRTAGLPAQLGLRRGSFTILVGVFQDRRALARWRAANPGPPIRTTITGEVFGYTHVEFGAKGRLREMRVALSRGRHEEEVACHEAVHAATHLASHFRERRCGTDCADERLAYLGGLVGAGLLQCLRRSAKGRGKR